MKLNGTWDIAYTEETPGRIGIPGEFKGKMSVPCCWDDYPESFKDYSVKTNEEHREMDLDSYGTLPFDGSLPFITGTVWYRKTINIPEKNEYSVLKVGRVCLDAAIYLNRELIGYHIGFSTNFEIVLPALEPGMHELVIAVTNTRRDRIGCFVRGFKGYSGGIFGDVTLQTCNNASVRNLYIHPDEDVKKLNWQVELHGHTDNASLHAKVFKKGELIDEIRISELTFQTDATKLNCWSDDDPKLYQIELAFISIGESAFKSCAVLTSVTIPDSVTNIDRRAFESCTSLTSVTIGNSVTSIGDWAFGSCTGLISVTIPASVTSIGKWAFAGCSGLTMVAVDPGNTVYSSLDGVLFDKNKATLIQCPGGKTGTCTIPDSVSSIGYGAFYGCSGLTMIAVDPGNTVYSSLDGVLFDKNKATLILPP
jgi:hypothetical protein